MVTNQKQKKTVVFLCSHNEIDEIKKRKSYFPDDTHYIAINRSLAELAVGFGFKCHVLFDYIPDKENEDLRKKTLFWLDDWANKKNENGFSIKEILSFKNFSLWWFALPVLFPDILRLVQYIDAVNCILDCKNPCIIYIFETSNSKGFPLRLNRDIELPNKVIDCVCKERGFLVKKLSLSWDNNIQMKYRNIKTNFLYKTYYMLGESLIDLVRRKILNQDRKIESTLPENNKNIFLLSSMVYWRENFEESGRLEKKDAIANSSIAELNRRGFNVIGIDFELNTPSWGRILGLKEKKNDQNTTWIAIENLIRRIPKSRIKRRKKSVSSAKKCSQEGGLGKVSMFYGGVDINPFLQGRINFLFDYYFNRAISYMEAIEDFANYARAQLMLLVYEEGPHGRAATLVGQAINIPTVALQHGTLSGPYIPAYYFTRVRKGEDNSERLDCPIPSITAVFGEQTKNMLTNVSAYPENSVKVVGMPSLDISQKLLRENRIDIAYKALKLDSTKPIVLVVSQPFLTNADKHYFMSNIFEASQKDKMIRWVIKLHPSESGKEWKDLFKTMQGNVDVSFVNGNIHAWILVSQAVVAWFSTAILEAFYLGKTVFAVRIPNCSNANEYIKDGIAIGVNNPVQLANFVKNQIQTSLTDNKIRAKYVYQTRRLASERIADLAEDLIRKTNRSNHC